MTTTVCKPVHETTETTNNGKVSGPIRDSYLTHVDEHTKVLMNNTENTRSMYTKI